jgi:hypothetical protein
MSFTLVKCINKQFPDAPPCVAWEIPELSQLEMVSGMSEHIPRWATRMLASVHMCEVNVGRQSVGSRIKGNWIVYSEKGDGQFVKGGVAYYSADEFKKNYTVIDQGTLNAHHSRSTRSV